MVDETIKVGIEPEVDEQKAKKAFDDLGDAGKKAGKEAGEGFESGFKKGVDRLDIFLGAFAANIATKAVSAIANTIRNGSKQVIAAARAQETAVNNLNTSLRLAGSFSQQASRNFRGLATQLQDTSVFSEDVILTQTALARNFTNTNAQAEKLIKAAVELSAQTGQTLDSSVRNLGKTFAGLTGELGESVPFIRNLSAESLKAGGALDAVLKRFGGAAVAQLNTFDGAVAQLNNNFRGFQAELGAVVTENPATVAAIRRLSKGVSDFAKIVRENQDDLRAFASFLLKNVVQAVTFAAEGVTKLTSSILTFQRAVRQVSGAVQLKLLERDLAKQAELSRTAATEEERLKAIQRAGDLRRQIRANKESETADRTSFVERIKALEGFRDRAVQLGEEISQASRPKPGQPDQPPPPPPPEAPAGDAFTTFDAAGNALTSFGIKIQSLRKDSQGFAVDFQKVANQVKTSAVQGIGRGVAGGFAAFGAALARGEDAIAAFAKAFIQGIAQAAIQLGTRFILEGVAISFNPLLGGPSVGGPLITAGAALAAFGGALGAVAGGGGGAGAAGAATGGDPGSQEVPESPLVAQAEPAEPTTAVNINVNGDILDSEDTGRRLAQIVSEASLNDGIVLSNVSTA